MTMAEPILCFDIETIPDVEALARQYQVDAATLGAEELVLFATQQRRLKNGSELLPLPWQQVICISCLMRSSDSLKLWSLAAPALAEGELIQRFFDGIDRYTPQLVSWNGGGFDLPVLHYRSLRHAVRAPRYWESGDGNTPNSRDFKYNNYLNRYHSRHLDLMDVLAAYQARATAAMSEVAQLLGFPGKIGMDGGAVWPAWCQGEAEAIRHYCETDVVNTYLIYTRFRRLRGEINPADEASEHEMLRQTLARLPEPGWARFLDAWASAKYAT